MSLRERQERDIREHVGLDERIRSLIGDAIGDLYFGPSCGTSEDYPGFIAACREIGEALPRHDLWVDENGCVSESEPDWCDADGEPQECPEAWTLYDALIVKRILVGRELASYV